VAEEALAIVKIGEGVLMIDATESAKATTTVSEVGPTMIPTPAAVEAEAEAEVVVADVVAVAAAVVAEMAVEAVTVVAEAADVAAEESLDSIVIIVHRKDQDVVEGVVAITNVHLAITTTKIDYFSSPCQVKQGLIYFFE